MYLLQYNVHFLNKRKWTTDVVKMCFLYRLGFCIRRSSRINPHDGSKELSAHFRNQPVEYLTSRFQLMFTYMFK